MSVTSKGLPGSGGVSWSSARMSTLSRPSIRSTCASPSHALAKRMRALVTMGMVMGLVTIQPLGK